MASQEVADIPTEVPDTKEKDGSSSGDVEGRKGAIVVAGGIPVDELEVPESKLATTRWELWSYYTYYIGNSGLGPFNFQPTAYQNLLALAGHNLGAADDVACDYSVPCVLPFAGIKERNINSIVLVTNGISFAIQVVLFLLIGGAADYGRWRPYILIVFTVISIAISFSWLGVERPDQWMTATGLYIVGLICYQVFGLLHSLKSKSVADSTTHHPHLQPSSPLREVRQSSPGPLTSLELTATTLSAALNYWTAAFPQLARNLPEMQDSQAKLISGETTPEAHNVLDSLSRNRLANIAFTVCSVGELVVLAVLFGILKAVHSSRSTEDNTKALSVVAAYSGGVWLACAIPWFIFEKHRPGQKVPEGTNIISVAGKQAIVALKEAWKLTDTMIYLVFYFLMSDVLNTGVTLISTLQYSILSYDTFKLNELLFVGIFTQAVGIYAFWWVQKTWKISTKGMFLFVVFWIQMLMLWGMIGTWTNKIGFHHETEIWLYQALYGLLVCPWYSYSQTMISEFIPEGKEFLFFSLFSVTGKTSAFIGPFVTSAIVARSNNTNTGFIFLFFLGLLACALLPFLSTNRSRKQCADYLEKDRQKIYAEAAREKAAKTEKEA